MSSLKYIVLWLVFCSFCFAEEESVQESFTKQVRENVMLQYAAAYTGAKYDEKKQEDKNLFEKLQDKVSEGGGFKDLFGLLGKEDDAKPDLGITLDNIILKKEIQKALLMPKELQAVPYYVPAYFYGPTEINSLSKETQAKEFAGLTYILENIVLIEKTWPTINISAVEKQIRAELLESGTIKDKNVSVSESESIRNNSEGSGSQEVEYGF